MTPVARALLATALLGAAGTAAVAALIAHRVIHPKRAQPTQILDVSGTEVTLANTALTRAPVLLGLLYQDERHLAVLQPPHLAPESSDPGAAITRTLQQPVTPEVQPGLGRAVGNVFAGPDQLGQPVHEQIFTTEHGPAPAWHLGPDTGDTWLIHIHGSLSGREGAFRSAAAASPAGLPALIPSYRGDGEGPPAPRGAFMLGQTEWHDIEPALDYAIEHGAQRIVLLGWSNGASMALRLAASSRNRAAIAGVVAISPVLDWANTIRHAARAAHIPAWIATLAVQALRLRSTATLLGAAQPIRFEDLTWKRAPVPVLLLHSAGDQTTPFADSLAFQARNPHLVSFPQLDPVPHALEWNADYERFSRELLEWMRHLRPVPLTGATPAHR